MQSRPGLPLATAHIATSSLSGAEREEAQRLIRGLGGTFTPNLTTDTTHLVTNVVGSEKYKVAIKRRIPVIAMSWLRECADIHARGDHSDPDDLIPAHRLLTFSGLLICVTGIDVDMRRTLEDQTRALGGMFAPDLSKACTHLVAETNTGKKVEFAARWNVKIVTLDWFNACVREQVCVDETPYLVSRPVSSPSSPAVVNGQQQQHHPSATRSNRGRGTDASTPPLSLRIFQNIVFFIGEGFSNEDRMHCEKLIHALGGLSSARLDYRTDYHVLKATPRHIPQTDVTSSSARLVKYQWLLDCYNNNRLVPLEQFLLPDLHRPKVPHSSQPEQSKIKIEQQKESEQKPQIPIKKEALPEISPPPQAQLPRPIEDHMEAETTTHFINKAPARTLRHEEPALSTVELMDLTEDGPRAMNRPDPAQNRDQPFDFPSSARSRTGSPLRSVKRISLSVRKKSFYSKPSILNSPRPVRISRHFGPNNGPGNHALSMSTNSMAIDSTRPEGLFSELLFTSHGFTDEENRILKSEALRRGGEFASFGEISDRCEYRIFIIVPLNGPIPRPPWKDYVVVTEFWIESCLENNSLLPIDSEMVFRPLQCRTPIDGFENIVVGISGFEGLERSHLGKMTLVLGAQFTESFSRKNSHLVVKCNDETSLKVKKAREWGIPVVSADWLFECARQGYFISSERYEMRPDGCSYIPDDRTTNMSKPVSPVSIGGNEDRDPVDRKDQNAVNVKQEPAEEMASTHMEECDIFDAGVQYRPKFDLRSLGSPFRGANNSDLQFSSPLDRALTKNLAKANENIENMDRSTKSAAIDPKPLEGLVVYISSKTLRRTELSNIVTLLGAKLVAGYSDSCTHLICDGGRSADLQKDVKLAKAQRKFLVSPSWLLKCSETGTRVNELDYPYTLNPNKSLAISAPSQAPTRQPLYDVSHMQDLDDPPSRQHVTPPAEAENPVSEAVVSTSTVDKYVTIVNQLVATADRDEETKKISATSPILLNKSFSLVSGQLPLNVTMDKSMSFSKDVEDESTSFVTYDDPDGRHEKRRLIEQLQSDAERKPRDAVAPSQRNLISQVVPSTSAFRNVKNSTESHDMPGGNGGGARSTARVFLLTGFNEDERRRYIQMVVKLGGKLLHSEFWDRGSTHLIAAAPTRTEKCLAACASGAWIMQPAYLTASAAAGRFVDETQWEWTAEVAKAKGLPADQVRLAGVVRRWRQSMQATGRGCFSGWKVLLVMDQKKRDGYLRVLQAGGAEVVSQPTSVFGRSQSTVIGKTEFTHCLTDIDVATSDRLKTLQGKGVTFLTSSYFGEYLLMDHHH